MPQRYEIIPRLLRLIEVYKKRNKLDKEENFRRQLKAVMSTAPKDLLIKLDATSSSEKLVFNTAYHQMGEHEPSVEWTRNQVVVTPTFGYPYSMQVIGVDIEDYLDYRLGKWLDAEQDEEELERKIEKYRIVRHGVADDHFFPGHSISLTEFTSSATGRGDTEHGALKHALEQLSDKGWDIEGIRNTLNDEADVMADGVFDQWYTKEMEQDDLDDVDHDADEGEDNQELTTHYFFVSVDVR